MKIVVLDVETTWLYNKKETNLDNQPHIIQFAWIFWEMTDEWEFIEEEVIDRLYKPPIEIPYEVSQIHHIYNVDVKDKWSIWDWLKSIIDKLNEADIIIGHNIEFDINMIKLEVDRLKMKWELIDFAPKKVFCTMNNSINYCAIIRKTWTWFKRPKLQGLTKKTLWVYFTWAHNALEDTKWTLKAFLKLHNEWVFILEEREQLWLFN